MAIIWRLCLLIIGCAVCKIQAAALQTTELIQANGKSNENADETVSTYQPSEDEHIAVNDSKVIIDLYKPNQRVHEANSDEKGNDELSSSAAVNKNVKPFVQVVINQQDSGFVPEPTKDIPFSEDLTTEASPTTGSDPLQLIPPASVNASIKQFEKESKQKQGQIIIRYAFQILFTPFF